MHTTYFEEDDILEIRFSDAPIVKEISENWNTCISLDAQGNIAQLVVLEARQIGAYPIEVNTKVLQNA